MKFPPRVWIEDEEVNKELGMFYNAFRAYRRTPMTEYLSLEEHQSITQPLVDALERIVDRCEKFMLPLTEECLGKPDPISAHRGMINHLNDYKNARQVLKLWRGEKE